MHLQALCSASLLASVSLGTAVDALSTIQTRCIILSDGSPLQHQNIFRPISKRQTLRASAATTREVTNTEAPIPDVTTAVLEAFPFVGKRRLTFDNTCGWKGAGIYGWTCDAELEGGGPCCSSSGYCGLKSSFCGEGCQPGFGECDKSTLSFTPSTVVRQARKPTHTQTCGKRNKNKKCGAGDCCSKNGYCGKADSYCDKGCQPQFGDCNPKKDEGSQAQRCGPENGNQTCSSPSCCAADGTCGTGHDYCSVPFNCQESFGRCESDDVPAGIETSTDPRPHNSTVPYGTFITKCSVPGTIALTYDDGPGNFTFQLLDILAKYDAKATFFVAGNTNGAGEIDHGDRARVLLRAYLLGHQIASHTFSHLNMSEPNSSIRKAALYKNERAIANVIGVYPQYMRPPYSACSSESGCVSDIYEMGYHVAEYDLDTRDWFYEVEPLESIPYINRFFNHTRENAIVIMHDLHETSVTTLTPYILGIAKQQGLKAVTLGDCLGDDPNQWYRNPESIDPMSVSPEGCIVATGGFCGNLFPFKTQKECYASVEKCRQQAASCFGPDALQAQCLRFEDICAWQNTFCDSCGGLATMPCDFKYFKYRAFGIDTDAPILRQDA